MWSWAARRSSYAKWTWKLTARFLPRIRRKTRVIGYLTHIAVVSTEVVKVTRHVQTFLIIIFRLKVSHQIVRWTANESLRCCGGSMSCICCCCGCCYKWGATFLNCAEYCFHITCTVTYHIIKPWHVTIFWGWHMGYVWVTTYRQPNKPHSFNWEWFYIMSRLWWLTLRPLGYPMLIYVLHSRICQGEHQQRFTNSWGNNYFYIYRTLLRLYVLSTDHYICSVIQIEHTSNLSQNLLILT